MVRVCGSDVGPDKYEKQEGTPEMVRSLFLFGVATHF